MNAEKKSLPESIDEVKNIYRRMRRIREFEMAAERLIDKGELTGSVHTSIGQEATCAGAGAALADGDLTTGTHRSHGHPIGKGADVQALMAELFGTSEGVCRGAGGSMHLADFSVGSVGESAIVAGSLPIAVGAGLVCQLKGQDRVVAAFFGDGASNAGAFHESLNMAAIWHLPIIFICENNQYSVSAKHEEVSSVTDIADRAVAYGIRGEIVDGQDALKVHQAVSTARAQCLDGRGPVLIEAKTYRFGDHSYRLGRLGGVRDPEEVERWRARDPLDIMRTRCIDESLLTGPEIDRIDEEVRNEIDAAIASARAGSPIVPGDVWGLMYSDPSRFMTRRHNVAWTEEASLTRVSP